MGELRPGDPRHIAGFEILGRLGQGGMGVVYLAEHPEMGPAALKFVQPGSDDGTFRARFRREVEAVERVRSPRVAPVLAADPDADTPWLATAFVDGPTLDEAVEARGPMAGERLVSLAVALADALAAIHAAGVVHRDLKPANILLTPDTPVVIDFGIAALREAPALTRTGYMVGTAGWMAPEQVRAGRPGPKVDVFTWGLVVAYAASGRPPFGTGAPDALAYRVVHEEPDLPALPDPLDRVVRSALVKDPRIRPEVADLLTALTDEPIPVPAGPTAVGPTLADRTEIVPTIVARGWGVDALPARPGAAVAGAAGLAGAAGAGLAGATGAAGLAGAAADGGDGAGAGVAAPPPPGQNGGPVPAGADVDPDRTIVEPRTRFAPTPGPAGPAGPPFWFAGAEHHDERSLAAAFQTNWDEAADQLFRRRNPVWIGELRSFLQARDLHEADRLVARAVAEGPGDAPPAAALARLLLALDPALEPRVGDVWLTEDGLVAVAQAVADGRDGGERLAEIRDAHVLRLWRSLPGMERAAWIDERWHASLEAFGRLAATVSPYVGWPTPADRTRASALLLLGAVHPDHERRLGRQLAAARRTAARHQAWWAQLAAEGQHAPAAAVLAVMTAERARALAQEAREAAREAERREREAERQERQRRAAAEAAVQQPEWRYRPLPKAESGVRRTWVLVVMVAALLTFLWTLGPLGDKLIAYYTALDANGVVEDDKWAADRLQAFLDVKDAGGLAGVLLLLLPAAYVANRAIVRRGVRQKAMVRLFAGAVAAVDGALGFVLAVAAVGGGLVLATGAESKVRGGVAPPFADDPWQVAGLLLPFGVVGIVLLVRSLWRLGRAVLGGAVAGPPLPAPPRRSVPAGPAAPVGPAPPSW